MNASPSGPAAPPAYTSLSTTTDRIHTPPTATTHYIAEFTLAARSGSMADAFKIATGYLSDWSKTKARLPGFGVRVQSHGADADAPEAWAMHLQHREPSSDYRRYWYVDVSLRHRDTGFDVRVSVSHCLDFGFVGWIPAPPEPSAPNFICEWLGHKNLTLRSGQFPIAALAPLQSGGPRKVKDRIRAMKVWPKDAEQLARLIFDPNRALPVLLINGDTNPITFPLEPNKLQQLFFGTCYVVSLPTTPGWGEAWRAHFPKGFSCNTNVVRLYQPGAQRESSHDPMRHRFFSDDEIIAHGGSAGFIAMIRDGLSRRLIAPRPGRISSCEDVLALNAAASFNAQRLKLKTHEELIAFYESEYEQLSQKYQRSDQLLQESDSELGRTRSELESLRSHAAQLAEKLEELKSVSAPAAPAEISALLMAFFQGQQRVVDVLRALPVMFPDRVVLLPSALRSAEDVPGFRRCDTLCELLLKLSLGYRDTLISGGGDAEAARIFGRNDFTTNEGNLSREGRRSRTFRYKGVDICMLHHLKIGVKESDAECLRVHFHWDDGAQKIVIGHCGKHLPL